ncbi:MAG: VanW family protein [Actinomycetota bacterium]|nr:VanW family protein [Actinomycetota bacterium]
MQAERERRRREQQTRRQGPLDRLRGSRRAVWVAAIAGVLIVWVLSGFVLRSLNSGEVLGGTSMAGIDLGGEDRHGAAELISGIQPRKVKLVRAQQTITVGASQAGLEIDSESSADRAYSAGRSGIGAVLKGPLTFFSDREVEPVFRATNEKRLTRTVNGIADRLDREPYVGALSIDSGTLAVTFEPPKAGVRVRRTVMREQLLEALESGRETMEIPVRRVAAPDADEVEAVAADAETFLRRPLRIRTAGGAAAFTPAQVAGILAIESTGNTETGIRLGADVEKTGALVAGFAEERDIRARDAGLDTPRLPPVNLTDPGDLTWKPKPGAASVTPARTGRHIVQKQAVDNTVQAVREGRHQVSFPTERVRPEITNSAMKNATSLLGTFTTSFSCCEPRVTNIQRMAETVDGTVIGPGEQFSLNGIAGERTQANGYKAAPTIGEGNKLIDTVGGGVSQFSTTTYNAAYFAGLQIDAHTPHSFYISRYPAGRESTLSYGSIDLLWTNDTGSPVVVRSSASDTAVTVSIYGGSDVRRVEAETQSRSDNDLGGFDITIDRIVVDSDGARDPESFTTVYGVPSD